MGSKGRAMAGPVDRETEKGFALAEAFRAVQSRPGGEGVLAGEMDDPELADSATILQGAKAVIGKAVWSANVAGRVADQNGEERREKEHRNAETEREMRELMHLAEWNAQMTVVGGVEMTNEEAQIARKHIIDNSDEYADRAVREGRIRSDERDDYRRTARRIYELEDKKGRGTITNGESAESDGLKRSRLGRESESDAGRYHKELKGLDASADANNSLRRQSSPAVADNSLFQSAPDLSKHYGAATTATEPLEKKPEPVIAPPSPRVAAMGVGV